MDKLKQMIPNWIIEPKIKPIVNTQGEVGNGIGKVPCSIAGRGIYLFREVF